VIARRNHCRAPRKTRRAQRSKASEKAAGGGMRPPPGCSSMWRSQDDGKRKGSGHDNVTLMIMMVTITIMATVMVHVAQ